jgi:succinate dehydrogenase/fumarate reductase flavoprotein subunit
VRDTQEAGAGLVDEHTARYIAQNSAQAIEWLVAQGVPFSPDPSGPLGLHLTREGGHAVRRIAHAADATGKAIHEALLARPAHPNVELRARWMAVDLITNRHVKKSDGRPQCHGVYALDIDRARWRPCRRVPWCWPPAAWARSTATPATPRPRPATASPWPGGPAAGWRTWSSSSSTRPACTTRRSAAS